MNDPLFHVVKGSGEGGGCWEIFVLIWVPLWRTGTAGFLLLFAKTVESRGPGLVPITAFMIENVFGDQVRAGHNNLKAIIVGPPSFRLMLLISTVQILLNTISTTVRGYRRCYPGLSFRFRKITFVSRPCQNLQNWSWNFFLSVEITPSSIFSSPPDQSTSMFT